MMRGSERWLTWVDINFYDQARSGSGLWVGLVFGEVIAVLGDANVLEC